MTDQEALRTIEGICGDDFCEDMAMRYLGMSESDLKTAVDKLSAIYRIAHSFVRSHSCFEVHDDWRQEASGKYAVAQAGR